MSDAPEPDGELKRLLDTGLEDEDRRLLALEERVQRLAARRTSRLLRAAEAGASASAGVATSTQRLPLEVPGALGGEEPPSEEAVSDDAIIEDELLEEPPPRRLGELGEEPSSDEAVPLPGDRLLEAPRPRGFEPVDEPPAPVDELLEQPRPRSFPDDESDELPVAAPLRDDSTFIDAFHNPVRSRTEPATPRKAFHNPETFRAQPTTPRKALQTRWFEGEGLMVGAPRAPATTRDLREEESLRDEPDEPLEPHLSELESPVEFNPAGFSELSLDGVPEVAVLPEPEAPSGALQSDEEARRLIAKTMTAFDDILEAPVLAVALEPAESVPVAQVVEPEVAEVAEVTEVAEVDVGRFGLERAFGAAPDLVRLLEGQRRLYDRFEALCAELDSIRSGSAPGRLARAEESATEAWQHVAEATGRTEKLVALVERLVDRVGRLESGPVPASATAPEPAPELAEPGATQQLIRLLRSGITARSAVAEPVPEVRAPVRLERSGTHERLLETVTEHQELLKEHARLLERMIDLEERA